MNNDKISNELGQARLYESVYKPEFDKVEKALTSGAPSSKYHGNEWNHAIAMVNRSKQLKDISKKYGGKIVITDTGPSENSWIF